MTSRAGLLIPVLLALGTFLGGRWTAPTPKPAATHAAAAPVAAVAPVPDPAVLQRLDDIEAAGLDIQAQLADTRASLAAMGGQLDAVKRSSEAETVAAITILGQQIQDLAAAK